MKIVMIGSTGLVGQEILKLLLADSRVKSVKAFSRRAINLQHPKLSQRLIDFEKIQDWCHEIDGDFAISCLGTTRSQAGGVKMQYRVDFTYQAQFAEHSFKNRVSGFILISSIGADSRSKAPYLRMKGELEDFVLKLGFPKLKILRPGPLVGARVHRRYAEEMMLPFNRWLSKIPKLADLEPVSSDKVALKAVQCLFDQSTETIISAKEIRAK